MLNRFILTPFFLDELWSGLELLHQSEWHLNRPLLGSGQKQERLAELYRPLRDAVAEALKQGKRPVSIAGDCCTSIGVLAGLQNAGLSPTLLWLDAHGDFNTWETTPSGFLGGMPLAMLVGRGERTIVDGVGLEVLPEDKVILSDARDLDPEESQALDESAIYHVPDIGTLLEMPLPDGSIWVHFDCDILNPHEAPAMSYLAPGGPSSRTLGQLFRHLAKSGKVIAISLSAWNPDLDTNGRTREVVMELLGELTQ